MERVVMMQRDFILHSMMFQVESNLKDENSGEENRQKRITIAAKRAKSA